MGEKYRLVTRSDFEGLVCAVLLKKLDLIDDIIFVHPKDMQDGKIKITNRDITANLPFVEGVYLSFDHHFSEVVRNVGKKHNHIIDSSAPSAARVVYDYYGGSKTFPKAWDELLAAVDKADAARFTIEEILNPEKWVLLNYIMDPRTGLGRFKDFRISNYQLMMNLIEYCKDHSIDEILQLPDVKERVDLYLVQAEKFEQQLKACSKVYKNLIILDLKKQDIIYAGNRFMIYALYPQCNISMHILWGLQKQNTVFAVGKSILNKTSKTNIGGLMFKYGGGGHANAGTCQVENDKVSGCMLELVEKMNSDG